MGMNPGTCRPAGTPRGSRSPDEQGKPGLQAEWARSAPSGRAGAGGSRRRDGSVASHSKAGRKFTMPEGKHAEGGAGLRHALTAA